MFFIHIEQLETLLSNMEPLTYVAMYSNFKCSTNMLSIIVSNLSPRFTAALRLGPPYFASFQSDGGGDYLARTSIAFLYQGLNDMDCMWFSMIMFLHEGQTQMPLQFRDDRDGHLSFVELSVLPPHNDDVGQIDYAMFVAISSPNFDHITRQFSRYDNDTIVVTISDWQVKFSVATEEIILTTEQDRRQCIIGGLTRGVEIRFSINLHPRKFFLKASLMTELVWFFKSTDWCGIINFPVGLHANILTYYPRR